MAFLREQLDEDEQVAREASWASPEWREGSSWLRDLQDPVSTQRTRIAPGSELLSPAEARHIARWDPSRVLAEVEAKRARIDLLAETAAKCPENDWPDDGGMEWAPLADYARHLLQLEAQPYASRSGFDPAWRLA